MEGEEFLFAVYYRVIERGVFFSVGGGGWWGEKNVDCPAGREGEDDNKQEENESAVLSSLWIGAALLWSFVVAPVFRNNNN